MSELEFSELEQEMLRSLFQLHSLNNLCVFSWVGKIFNEQVTITHFGGDKEINKKIIVHFTSLSKDEVLLKLKYFHFLVTRLEFYHLIKIEFMTKNVFNFEKINTDNHFELNPLFETGVLYSFFTAFGNSPLLVSHYLINLIENNFKTPEQIRFESQLKDTQEKHNQAMKKAGRQIKIAWAAFITSILAVIASWTLGLFQILIELLLSNT